MDNRKRLGICLRSKRKRVDSDPSVQCPETRETAVDEPGPSRPRSHSVGTPHFKKIRKHNSEENLNVSANSEDDSGVGPSLLVPGHRYLGPGNPLRNGQPTNQVDEAARQHDIRYSQAEDTFRSSGNLEEAYKNIQDADEDFLYSLDDIEPGTYTEAFGKFVGKTGIGIKKGVEGTLHSTLYPMFSQTSAMDVVDSGPTTEGNMFYSNAMSSSAIHVGSGVDQAHTTNWTFNKNFNLAFKANGLQYKKSNASNNVSKGETEISTYIHSLPWEKLYFYVTEREYNTITNTFHTAYVEYVKVKIINLGVSNPVLTSTSTVNYKIMNANNYISVWRGFERHGPCTLGKEITPKVLYGTSISELNEKASLTDIPITNLGAISEMKQVSNNVVYNKVTSTWDTVNNKKIDISEAKVYLPPLSKMAVITVNANNTGLIYETTYKPNDGLFHNKSFAFHNRAVVQHKPYEQNVDLADKGKISSATYEITDNASQNKPITSYENATIDNMFYRSLRSNPNLHFVDGLGVGLNPRRDQTGVTVDAVAEFLIETEIKISAEAFGGSVLASGTDNSPQSNPNRIYFVHKNKKFGNAYASDGLPTMTNIK